MASSNITPAVLMSIGPLVRQAIRLAPLPPRAAPVLGTSAPAHASDRESGPHARRETEPEHSPTAERYATAVSLSRAASIRPLEAWPRHQAHQHVLEATVDDDLLPIDE